MTKGARPFMWVPVIGQQKSASLLGMVLMLPAAAAAALAGACSVEGVSLRSIRCLRLVMCDSDLGIACMNKSIRQRC